MRRPDLDAFLFRRIDIAGLVVFRMLFGIILAGDMLQYILHGWVRVQFVEPAFTFKFAGFGWLPVFPGPVMYAIYGASLAAAVAIAAGAFYRLSCAIFFLCHTYTFLAAAEYYLNHAYLISLLTLVMAFLPAHRAFSLDAARIPGLRTREIERWPVVLLCGTQILVYVFGAIAKCNADWLVGFEPVRHWLRQRAATLPGPVGEALASEVTVRVVSWGGTLFDFAVTPLLLGRRTRLLGLAGALFFHLCNAFLFEIGVFPWLMLAATTLFFEPSWPRRLPFIGKRLGSQIDEAPGSGPEVRAAERRFIVRCLTAYTAIMIAVPLRHHLYPGDVAWSEEGHLFSWRMKLRDKRGRITLRVTDPATGLRWTVYPGADLTHRQVAKMASRPDLILQYVEHVHERYRRDHGMDVEIRADVFVSLNYRPEQRFVDPEVDLAKENVSLGAYSWIVPFEDGPLPPAVPPAETGIGPTLARVRAMVQRGLEPPGPPDTSAPLRIPVPHEPEPAVDLSSGD